MKDYSINKVINNYFEIYHKDLTILDVSVQKIRDEYKTEHKKAKFEVEVLAVYSIEDILLKLGYKKEEIAKNIDNDIWLNNIERKHLLKEKTLTNPSEYYLFIEDSEKYHNDHNWKDYYNKLKKEFLNEKQINLTI